MKVADSSIMGQHRFIAIWLSKIQDPKSLTLCWRSFLRGSRDIVTSILHIKAADTMIIG